MKCPSVMKMEVLPQKLRQSTARQLLWIETAATKIKIFNLGEKNTHPKEMSQMV